MFIYLNRRFFEITTVTSFILLSGDINKNLKPKTQSGISKSNSDFHSTTLLLFLTYFICYLENANVFLNVRNQSSHVHPIIWYAV